MGEYIVQLAGEKPSHIIMPAIHKTKQEIAKLFASNAGRRPTPTTWTP
jgi:L-lactate dehydrogenase complex protein LldF